MEEVAVGGPGRAPPITSEPGAAGPQLLGLPRMEVRPRMGPGLRANTARGEDGLLAGSRSGSRRKSTSLTRLKKKSLPIKISRSRPVAMSACLHQDFPRGRYQAPCTGRSALKVRAHPAQQLGANINRKEKYLDKRSQHLDSKGCLF